IKKEDIVVKDSEVEDTLKHIQHQRMEFKPLDDSTPTDKGHFITIDYEGLQDGAAFEGNKAADAMFEVGTPALVPGFGEELVGMKVGETRKFDLTIPQDFQVKELAGKKVEFTVKLKKIEEKILPQIDDELAKSVGEYDSLESLKKEIHENIKKTKEEKATKETEDQLIKQLIEKNPFAAPPAMIKSQREFLWNDVATRLKTQGVPDEQLQEYEKKWESEMREESISRVKAGLLLDEIAKKEEIKVSPEDVQNRVKQIQAAYQNKPEVKKLLKSQEVLGRIYREILQQRVIDMLINEAKVRKA
ncbi:trigger factor, partial [Bdellovibrionota bacterium]